ncbi:MAG: hypothetical protein MZV65_37300 [Chromatiales bacterium]|nr:hypothetical protein [Chromatiales bacterium]
MGITRPALADAPKIPSENVGTPDPVGQQPVGNPILEHNVFKPARVLLARRAQRPVAKQRPAHRRTLITACGVDNHLRPLQADEAAEEQRLERPAGRARLAGCEQAFLGTDIHHVQPAGLDAQRVGKEARMLGGVGEHYVGRLEQPLFLAPQPPRAGVFGWKLAALEHLLVVGADQRIEEQRNSAPARVATGGGDVALAETRNMNEIGTR